MNLSVQKVRVPKMGILSCFLLKTFPRDYFIAVVTLVPIVSHCEIGSEF